MKTIILISICSFSLLFAAANDGNASKDHDHDGQGICFGYAMARAFNVTCNKNDYVPNSDENPTVDENYFDYFESFSYAAIEVGDIVVFKAKNHHVAYVTDKYYPVTKYTIWLSHKPGPSQPVPPNDLPLSWFIEEEESYGNPVGYYKKKKAWSFKVKNSTGTGNVKVDGSPQPSSDNEYPAHWNSTHSIRSLQDSVMYDGYIQRFEDWKLDLIPQTKPNSTSFSLSDPDNNKDNEWIADLRNEYHITFANVFTGISNGGTMEVDGEVKTLPDDNPVYWTEGEYLTFKALSHSFNNINYSFSQWQDGVTSYQRTIEFDDHSTYTAYFIGKPTNVQNVHNDGAVGQPIHLVWNQHPNSNVKYRIYRKVKQHGDIPYLIATLNNNVTSYTDNDYSKTRGYTDLLLWYDARAYYTTEGTEASPSYHAVYGDYGFTKVSDTTNTFQSLFADYTNTLEAFPNPFNPVTQITFTLANESYVSLMVYNVSGQLIKPLIANRYFNSGRYSFSWNGQNENGLNVSSGLYLVVLKLNNKIYNKKLLLVR